MGRDSVGISSVKTGENPVRRKTKVSNARSIRVGLVGPKPRPSGVGDGQQVNIPVPPVVSDEGTQWGRPASYWMEVLSL